MNPIIEEAQKLVDPNDIIYDMISEGDYDYLLEKCKTGQEFIDMIKKIRAEMYKHFFVNAILAEINREIK
jgi:hypothetical protein